MKIEESTVEFSPRGDGTPGFEVRLQPGFPETRAKSEKHQAEAWPPTDLRPQPGFARDAPNLRTPS